MPFDSLFTLIFIRERYRIKSLSNCNILMYFPIKNLLATLNDKNEETKDKKALGKKQISPLIEELLGFFSVLLGVSDFLLLILVIS